MTTSALTARSLASSLTVKDAEASLAWYRDVFGFAVERRMEHEGTLRGVAMEAGAVRLLLNQDNGAKGWERAKGEGISLMLTLADPAAVDEAARRIKAAGGTLESEPADMPWGARAFRLVDPDGYRFAITSPRPG